MAKPERTAEEFIPARATLSILRDRAAGCTACDLYKLATQTVFGDGGSRARILLVGEQPGDKEDLAGRPFLGPAGKLLDSALEAAGIDRQQAYVTNVVKHFKWEPRGKRIHKKPNAMEIAACRPWFDAEVKALNPEIVVCLGATAAQSLLGRDFKVTKRRGELITESSVASAVLATIHPSAILRAPDEEARREAMRLFIHDLKVAADYLYRSGRRAA